MLSLLLSLLLLLLLFLFLEINCYPFALSHHVVGECWRSWNLSHGDDVIRWRGCWCWMPPRNSAKKESHQNFQIWEFYMGILKLWHLFLRMDTVHWIHVLSYTIKTFCFPLSISWSPSFASLPPHQSPWGQLQIAMGFTKEEIQGFSQMICPLCVLAMQECDLKVVS